MTAPARLVAPVTIESLTVEARISTEPPGHSGPAGESWKINGKPLGTYRKTPFRVDVTSALTPGANTLEIKVINLWINGLIGDQQEGVTTKYTYTAQQFYRADSPLLPSGLLGPVQVVRSVSR